MRSSDRLLGFRVHDLYHSALEVHFGNDRYVIEVPATRETVRHLLDDGGWPLLVLRFGVCHPAGGAASHTPRLSTDQTVDRTLD